jgi:predicted nucleotidyltransferase
MYHYLNMGKKSFDDVEGQPEVKLKKLFYALRAAFSCKWIMDKGTTPPIVFHTMLNELEIAPSIKSRILELIELKSHQDESYVHPIEQELNDFIKTIFDQSGVVSLSLKGRKEKQVDLDGLFLQILNQY